LHLQESKLGIVIIMFGTAFMTYCWMSMKGNSARPKNQRERERERIFVRNEYSASAAENEQVGDPPVPSAVFRGSIEF
jgi:hypothetical protein